VEILVAMVILVIGIFGIIRVFPTGFGWIQYGERVSKANKLANAALEQARSRSENLPDAIVPMTPDPSNAGQATLDATLTPGVEANDFVTRAMPSDPVEARFYGFNRTRRVIGETTKIPPPSSNVPYMPPDARGRPQLISLYTVQYGPMDILYRRPLVYSGQPMERVIFSQEPTQQDAADLGLTRYGVMYGRDRLVLYFAPASYPRVFKIQYSYVISDPSGPFRSQSLPAAAVPVPANAFRAEVVMPTNGVPEQGEELVARAFNELPLATPFSNVDPFEYKLLNPFVGILGFNPLGSLVRRGSSNRGMTAKIDYDVADWHVISEDVVVSQEPPFRVKLTLDFLKRAGEVQDNQETYGGLLMPSLANIDMVVVDLDRGLTIDSRTLIPENASDNGTILYRSGAVDFNPQGVQWTLPAGNQMPPESIAGKHLRIYYRTENEFGLQVQKAFTNYLRSQNPLAVTPGQYGQMPHGYVLFPASDHNHTVLVDYTFTDIPTGKRVRVSGELQPIRDPVVSTDTPRNVFASLPDYLWFVRVNNSPKFSAADPFGRANVMPNSVVIHSVRGVSVRSRVAWREGPRWRRLENSTYLARQGT
jgi:type II secretory pathway pseudopilin PulG